MHKKWNKAGTVEYVKTMSILHIVETQMQIVIQSMTHSVLARQFTVLHRNSTA